MNQLSDFFVLFRFHVFVVAVFVVAVFFFLFSFKKTSHEIEKINKMPDNQKIAQQRKRH